MRRFALWVGLAAALGLTIAIARTGFAQAAAEGHRRMLEALEQIRSRTDADNHYLGDAGRGAAELQLAGLAANAPELTRFRLSCLTSIHDMRLGNTEEAIRHLTEANDLLARVRARVPKEIAEEAVFQLGVAWLRLGEVQNCVHGRTGESCILPIRGGGVHVRQTGARKAIEQLTVLLRQNADHLTARWLLNIAYMTVGEYPRNVPKPFLIPPEAFRSDEEFPRFTDVAREAGLTIEGLAGGAIADDFNGDGWLDLVVSDWSTSGQIRYFENRAGKFIERTKAAGLNGLYGGLNIIQADYDNDGDLDILIPRGAWLEQAGRHPMSLLENDGHARFRDVAFEAGLGETHYPTQTAAWTDYDNDGDLDLYVGNENFPSQLFQNDGSGKFRDVAKQAGVENNRFAKGAVWGDYNGDRYPDLYISNMEGLNRLYRNNRDGTFTDVAPETGVTKPVWSFPAWFWDFNNDGALDLYVASYHPDVRRVAAGYLGLPHDGEPACLYQGDGAGGFREVAARQNLARVSPTMGANFGDLDNDGFPDLYLGTGYPMYEGLMPNLLYRNRAGGGFSDVTTAAGMGHLQKGHGVSFADFDNDGDQDVFAKLGGSFPGDAYSSALFRNPGFKNHWITIRLTGKKSNRQGVGARIRADITDARGKRSVFKWVNSGGSFGANPLRQEIGSGSASRVDVLEIFWPTSGQTQRFLNVPADRFIEITEGESSYRKWDVQSR